MRNYFNKIRLDWRFMPPVLYSTDTASYKIYKQSRKNKRYDSPLEDACVIVNESLTQPSQCQTWDMKDMHVIYISKAFIAASYHLTPLEVECSLILQPPPVISHATDFLTVVIRHWVLHRGRRRVDAELLNARVESSLFLRNLWSQFPVVHVKYRIPKEWPNQPPHNTTRERTHSQNDNGVQPKHLRSHCIKILRRQHNHARTETSKRRDDGGYERYPPTCLAECEETIPCELCVWVCGCRGGGCGCCVDGRGR